MAAGRTPPTLAVRLQHHESRAGLLPRLLAALDGCADVEVVADPGGRMPDTWRAHRACLEALPEQASHLVVLQDDCLPQPEFCERLAAAAERRPESILLAFTPGFPRERKLMMETKAKGGDHYPFIVGAYVPLVAVVYPAAVAHGLLAWAAESRHAKRGADDGIVAEYVRKRRLWPLALVPCLADHDSSLASVMNKRMRQGRHRRAALL